VEVNHCGSTSGKPFLRACSAAVEKLTLNQGVIIANPRQPQLSGKFTSVGMRVEEA
jgi:hypothetical protein